MYQAKSTIYRFATLLAVYINKESRFYHDPSLIKPMLLALDYVDRVQHENGLFDYVTCNFFSAPDTAFCIVKIIPHLRYMRAMQEKNGNGRNAPCPHGKDHPLGAAGGWWKAASTRPIIAGP